MKSIEEILDRLCEKVIYAEHELNWKDLPIAQDKAKNQALADIEAYVQERIKEAVKEHEENVNEYCKLHKLIDKKVTNET